MNHTKVEYVLNPDGSPGYSWPIFTGCGQPASVCATRATCWARLGHHRFGSEESTKLGKKYPWNALYNLDFSPRFNEQLLDAPFSLRKPSTIAVGFGGDLFGPGVPDEWIQKVLRVVRAYETLANYVVQGYPDHKFLFLTKSPERLAQLNPWPPNAWVGCSITGAESLERQQTMIGQLSKVEGGKRWVNYEPVLGQFRWPAFLVNIEWLVVGAQSGPGAVWPALSWVNDIINNADMMGVPIWIKDNLLKLFPELPRKQTRPQGGEAGIGGGSYDGFLAAHSGIWNNTYSPKRGGI